MASLPHRKRLKRYEIENQPRFLTFSCIDRLPLFKNDRIKDTFAEHLAAARGKHRFRLFAWVVMPEHVHLLVTPDHRVADAAAIARQLKGDFARVVIARWKNLGAGILSRLERGDGRFRFWLPGGGFDRNVRDEEEFFNIIEYIHGNPVRRGLVGTIIEWKWSSARRYAGIREEGDVPIDSIWE